jgi:hypothetical protein
MNPLRIGLSALAICLLNVTPADAQNAMLSRTTHDGMWLSAGVGGGWTRVTCTICRTDRNLGPSGYVRVGTTLGPGLLIAVEADGWTRSEQDLRSTATAAGVAAYLYPEPTGGAFLKSGLAWVRYGVEGSVSANLVGLLVGAGYDFPIAARLSVTNYVNLVASSFGALRSDRGTVASDVSLSVLQFGIGLTRH